MRGAILKQDSYIYISRDGEFREAIYTLVFGLDYSQAPDSAVGNVLFD